MKKKVGFGDCRDPEGNKLADDEEVAFEDISTEELRERARREEEEYQRRKGNESP